jgi:hypothetical protein
MRRVSDLDVLACPRCGGRLRVIAAVQDPLAVQAILAYRARSGAGRGVGSAWLAWARSWPILPG